MKISLQLSTYSSNCQKTSRTRNQPAAVKVDEYLLEDVRNELRNFFMLFDLPPTCYATSPTTLIWEMWSDSRGKFFNMLLLVETQSFELARNALSCQTRRLEMNRKKSFVGTERETRKKCYVWHVWVTDLCICIIRNQSALIMRNNKYFWMSKLISADQYFAF